MPKWTIYLLRDPDDRNAGYVGQTRRNLATRLRQHLNECRRINDRRSRWLRTVIARGLRPIVETLEVCDSATAANRAEIAWIARCERERGMVLTNTAPGGYFIFDEEGRKTALRRAMKHPETKKRKSAASRRKWDAWSKEEKDRWLSSFTPDSRRRQAEKMKAKWADPEWRAATMAKKLAAHARPEERMRKSAAAREYLATSQGKRQRSESSKAVWRNPANQETNAARVRKIAAKLTKYTEPCRCGRKVWGHGRCSACLKYFHRTGRERPEHLFSTRAGG